MPKVRIKKNNLNKLAKQIKEEVKKRAHKTLPPVIKAQVIDENILKGKSPVQGGGRFKRYSDSYKKQIRRGRYSGKKASPVNLKSVGTMLKSFLIRRIPNGFKLTFRDEKAEYHDSGAGKLPKRRMLPGDGERFNRRIERAINTELVKQIKKVSRKIRIKRFFGF